MYFPRVNAVMRIFLTARMHQIFFNSSRISDALLRYIISHDMHLMFFHFAIVFFFSFKTTRPDSFPAPSARCVRDSLHVVHERSKIFFLTQGVKKYIFYMPIDPGGGNQKSENLDPPCD